VPKVAKGERPPLSDDCPGDYATLVEQVALLLLFLFLSLAKANNNVDVVVVFFVFR
jgi:hypothetical protein